MSQKTILGLAMVIAFESAVQQPAHACTSVVVGPGASSNMRPLLWKNRDSDARHNQLVLGDDGKYRYIGVANAGDDLGREIWMGVNDQGLAVINTAADDLALADRPKDGEGRFLKTLLQRCATVAEVEAVLAATNAGGRDVNMHLGVIDKAGQAAFFEVAQTRYVKSDTTDRKAAPSGYVVRTNFGFTAPEGKGGGYLRFDRAQALLAEVFNAHHRLDAASILTGPSLDLANTMTGIDPRVDATHTPMIMTHDTINRHSTVSAAVFEGALPHEPGYRATMWVALGQPIASLAIPVWPVPQTLTPLLAKTPQAELEELSDRLRMLLYPDARGSSAEYLNARLALALRRQLDPVQQQIFTKTATELRALEAKGTVSPASLAAITQQCALLARDALARALKTISSPPK